VTGVADDRDQIAGGVLAHRRGIRRVEAVGGKDDDAKGDAQQDVGDIGQVGLGDVSPACRSGENGLAIAGRGMQRSFGNC
jgi:hypothetical protein